MASPTLTRRGFLGSASAAALIPATAGAQSGPAFEAFAARCRALSGFDPLPRELVAGALGVLDDMEATAFAEGHAAARDIEKTVLKALYTGAHAPERGEPVRFAYSGALMYAAIEDTVNVPSFCGGLPGFWAEPPVGA